MTGKQDSGGRRSPQDARNERLAAALRANLKRRKMQARGRAEGEKPAGPRRQSPEESPQAPGTGREKPGN